MDSDNNQTPPPSWFERLSQLLLREPQDRAQLVDLLRDAEERQLLEADALGMIEGVLQVSDMQVRDIMIPRAQMVVVDATAKPNVFLPVMIDSAHSRFPVVGETRDEVIGILLAKDLLKHAFHEEADCFDLKKALRPAVFVPESKRLNVLLRDFRINHNHMAIVVDEYGGVSGLVTIEDVLEQIVGEIEDEYDVDDDEFQIRQQSELVYIVKALTPIEDFNERFDKAYSDEEFDTIGGIVLNQFGRMPRRGDTITLDEFEIKVLRADQRRLHLLEVTIQIPDDSSV